MKWAMIAAAMITLPAIAAAIYFLMIGKTAYAIAAGASVFGNSLPFIVVGLLLRRNKGNFDIGH
ncbi:MAG TPA: hypothetical protein VFX98_19510 [Longimicrobiaceae bacterium]|nr:hypothetical protein [Longimicrobiaceae bacterium]